MNKEIGPWYLCRSENDSEQWDIRLSPEHGWRGDEYMSLHGIISEERARVAAAAPELFEAARTALSALESIANEMTVGDRFTNAGQLLLDALEPCRAALAKARGES